MWIAGLNICDVGKSKLSDDNRSVDCVLFGYTTVHKLLSNHVK